jgi:hypothetical protein
MDASVPEGVPKGKDKRSKDSKNRRLELEKFSMQTKSND